jgi:TonB family protein
VAPKLHLKGWGLWAVLREKLQSGFLLFETQQGLVRVELSFWQRAYLLWTFRNFRQLSLPTLNPRQRAMINALFPNGRGVVSHAHDPLLAIGVVENFVPPAGNGAAPTPRKERSATAVPLPAKIAPRSKPVRSSLPGLAWTNLATTLGALLLFVISLVGWYRIHGTPGSQAHDQPQSAQMYGTVTSNAPQPRASGSTAASLTAVAPTAASASPHELPKGVVQSALISEVGSASKQANHIRNVTSTPGLSLAVQDSTIQASRPPLRFVYPVYPEVRARGVVALTARVDSDGSVRSVRVVSGNRALAAAAVHAVRQWRYRPYLKDDQAVATETNIVISFISDDAISMSFPPNLPPAETQLAKQAH